MTARRAFPADPRSVKAARAFALSALGGMPTELLTSVELMVSELATNCVRHVGSAFVLTLTTSARELVVEVADEGGGVPRAQNPGPDEPTGRGLQIVAMLSRDWGVRPGRGRGKTVWFRLDTPPVPSSRGAGRATKPPVEGGGAYALSWL